MFDLVQRTPWEQLIGFFAQGNPPIIVQILILNGIFILWFASRRMTPESPAVRALVSGRVPVVLFTRLPGDHRGYCCLGRLTLAQHLPDEAPIRFLFTFAQRESVAQVLKEMVNGLEEEQ